MVTRLTRLIYLISIITLCLLFTAQSVKAEPSMLTRLAQTYNPKVDFIYTSSGGTFTEQFSSIALSPRGSCSLPAPTLTSPKNAIQVNTLIPYFQWNGTGTDIYYIQVSAFSDFSNPTIDTFWSGFSGGTNVSALWKYNLLPDTTYYWRVASGCSDYTNGVFSSTATFKTENITGPFIDPPAMTAPSDGAVFFTNTNVMFSWENVPGAEGWQFRTYSSLSDAQNNIENSDSWSGGWSTNFTDSFSVAGTYYWRLQAQDNIAWGSLSPIRSFTVIQPYNLYLPLINR